ncbi:hypothetical protein SAY87_016642 [Trapa incisa]|uniref:Tify domain-containing protein n=1 Tax=Trapa incisa TaxID=236973 RepID=A0AAN7L760_9MYRT|nr:hypothetical protein SAY87_016642 [Trapa incisa]
MSRTAVELDFFGMEKEKLSSYTSSATSRPLHSQRSFRGIQSAISRINPELLKSVIATSFSTLTIPNVQNNAFPPLPVHVPNLRPTIAAENSSKQTAPLTLFYNGTLTIFNVSPDEAESILKLAAEASSNTSGQENNDATTPSMDQKNLLRTFGAGQHRSTFQKRIKQSNLGGITSMLLHQC